MRSFTFIAIALSLTCFVPVTAAAQQLPAGTRDAADNTREAAANVSSARLTEAETALEKSDYPTAIRLLTDLLKQTPHDAHLSYDLGYALERGPQTDDNHEGAAASAYAYAISDDPNYPEPRLALGLLDARVGRLGKAHGELAAVTELPSAPATLRARAFRALAQLDSATNPAAASDDLLQAIKLTGETTADTELSATLAARSGDPADAEAEYHRLLALHPDDSAAASGLAHLELQANHPAAAEQTLTTALAAHPDDVRLISQMSSALAAQGKTKPAIALVERLRAAEGEATTPALLRQLARLYALDGSNGQAEVLYKAALAKEPAQSPDPTLMDDLADILVREQKYAEAEALLKRAVALRDQFPSKEAFGDAAGHLAFAASKNNDPQVCLQALALRATVLPNSGPSLFLEATAHDTLHQYKEAIRSYRAFLALAGGQFPDQEFQARHRLVALEHQK